MRHKADRELPLQYHGHEDGEELSSRDVWRCFTHAWEEREKWVWLKEHWCLFTLLLSSNKLGVRVGGVRATETVPEGTSPRPRCWQIQHLDRAAFMGSVFSWFGHSMEDTRHMNGSSPRAPAAPSRVYFMASSVPRAPLSDAITLAARFSVRVCG